MINQDPSQENLPLFFLGQALCNVILQIRIRSLILLCVINIYWST